MACTCNHSFLAVVKNTSDRDRLIKPFFFELLFAYFAKRNHVKGNLLNFASQFLGTLSYHVLLPDFALYLPVIGPNSVV